jgi:hypothetical protein
VKLYYGKIAPSAFASTTSQVGYPASNLGNEALLKPWRGTGVGAETVTFTLPVAQFVAGIFMHDVNFAAAAVETTPDGVNWFAAGNLTTYAGRHGRRRGVLLLAAANVLGFRLNIAAGASTDGLGYWRGGAGYAFTSSFAMNAAALPDFGYRVRTARPRLITELVNGISAVASTGANFDRIDFQFTRKNTESIDELIQRSAAGTCLIDMELPNYPEQVWPVRCLEEELEEVFAKKNVSTISVPLKEMVGA